MGKEKDSKESYLNKRSHIRFKADLNTIAQVGFQDKIDDFEPELLGLVFSEAYNGCGLVMLDHMAVEKGEICIIKCGDIVPTLAKIRWVQRLDGDVIKVGIEYNP